MGNQSSASDTMGRHRGFLFLIRIVEKILKVKVLSAIHNFLNTFMDYKSLDGHQWHHEKSDKMEQ